MKPELEKLCADYIVNRDTVGKAFRWDSSDLYSVCANMFCACGQAADADRLKECREIIRKHTGLFSPLGVSSAGGFVHNLGQLLTATLLTVAPLHVAVAATVIAVSPTVTVPSLSVPPVTATFAV